MKIVRVAASVATVLVLSAGVATAQSAQRITFTKDILPILQDKCQDCHRPSGINMSGMIAPMSLMTYEEVRPWAKSIAKSVSEKVMPPWHVAEEFHGAFSNERVLTDEEIDTIVTWVKQRAPRGNPKDAPAPIRFPESGWTLGQPDLVIDFPQPYLVVDEVEDLYHNVSTRLTDEQLPNDRWIKAIEFKPGSEVVHHMIGYATAPEEGGDVSGVEGEVTRGMLGGNAPGTDFADFPEGFGIKLPKNSQITFAMHYHKEQGPGTSVLDSSQIGIRFHEDGAVVTHPIEISTIAHGAFEIPPGVDDWRVGASRTFHEDTILLSMLPHMHLRGKSAKYTAIYPDGTTEVLLDVPAYDFNWQHSYNLAEHKILPAGTRIEMDLVYDNSALNAERVGFDPTRAIRFGGPTTDEMDLAWVTLTPVAPQIQAPSGD